MLFKNIILYQLTTPFNYSSEALNEKLQTNAYLPCPRYENASQGFVSPYQNDHELFVHTLQHCMLFAFCKEEKIIPSSVIKDELQSKIMLLEKNEGRTVYRKEKNALKEEILLNLRQQAFTRKTVTYAYVDTKLNWLIINTASRNKAEEICSLLRKTLGSFKVSLPGLKRQPHLTMTHWLTDKQDLPNFTIDNNCEMLDPKQKSAMIKCKEQDLNADEIIKHLQLGKQVVKLAMSWDNKISFEFSEDLAIKKIKFADLMENHKEEIKNKTPQERLDMDFAIMTGEFSNFLPNLWSLFDGFVPVEEESIN